MRGFQRGKRKGAMSTTMIKRLAALILLTALCQTMDLPEQMPVAVVASGDDFLLACQAFEDHRTGLFYMHKLKFGYVVQTVAAGSYKNIKLDEQFEDSRYRVGYIDSVYYLSIRNVSKHDEATYLCQAGTAYEMRVLNSTFLHIDDHKNGHKSVYVKQSPETQLVTEGDSVSLQCSLLSTYKESREQCPGEHSVFWFRAETGDSHPAVIYSQSHRRDGKDRRSCAYTLSKTFHNSSDAGTYYCAVMTCGEILFGEGTTLTTRADLWSCELSNGSIIIYLLCSILVLCVIVMVLLIYGIKNNKCDQDADALQEKLAKINPKKKEDTWIYSAAIFSSVTTNSDAMKGNQDRERIYAAVRAFGLD